MPTKMMVTIMTGGDGVAYPPHPPMIETPTGRGRATLSYTRAAISVSTKRLPRKTIRCRHRRKIMSAATVPSPSTVMPQPEPAALIARAM